RAQHARAPPRAQRPHLPVAPAAKNVVPFRPALPMPAEKRAALTPVERTAFQEIAKALGARLEGDEAAEAETPAAAPERKESESAADEGAGAAAAREAQEAGETPADDSEKKKPRVTYRVWPRPIPSAYAAGSPQSGTLQTAAIDNGERAVLDRLPVGVLVFRGDILLHANRALLEWTAF